MKKYFLLLLAIAYLQQGFAQPKSKKMGEIEPEYLKMTTYEADPNASALILMSEGYLSYGLGTLTFTFHGRVKILNKSGLDAANVKIPYYNDGLRTDRIVAMSAAAYKMDEKGEVIVSKFDEKNLVDERVHDNVRQKKIFIPSATEGSVIEYSYTITSDFFSREFDWYFQQDLPVLWSEYTICLPKGVDAGTMLQDNGKVTKKFTPCSCNGEPATGFSWTAQYLDALKPEPYMTSMDNYAIRLLVRMIQIAIPGYEPLIVMSDWKRVSGELWFSDYFGRRFTQPGKNIKKKAESLTANIAKPKDKMTAIYDYVKKQMIFDGRYSLWSSSDDGTKEILEQRKGSSSDINLLLTAMLRAVDIDAVPALCSTTQNGTPIKDYPSSSQFDHVLSYVRIDTSTYLLDAISPLRPYNVLSSQTADNPILVLSDRKEPIWIDPTVYQTTKSTVYIDANLTQDVLHLNIQKNETGYDALETRAEITKNGEKETVSEWIKDTSIPMTIDSFKVTNLTENLSEQLKIRFSCSTELDKDANFLTISYALDNSFKANPFKETKRRFPINFSYPFEQSYNFVLHIPKGYAIENLPAETKLGIDTQNSLSFYCLSQKISDDKIQITTRLILKRTQFSPQDYPQLQTFFDKVAEKLNEMVVIKKL